MKSSWNIWNWMWKLPSQVTVFSVVVTMDVESQLTRPFELYRMQPCTLMGGGGGDNMWSACCKINLSQNTKQLSWRSQIFAPNQDAWWDVCKKRSIHRKIFELEWGWWTKPVSSCLSSDNEYCVHPCQVMSQSSRVAVCGIPSYYLWKYSLCVQKTARWDQCWKCVASTAVLWSFGCVVLLINVGFHKVSEKTRNETCHSSQLSLQDQSKCWFCNIANNIHQFLWYKTVFNNCNLTVNIFGPTIPILMCF